ncbi:MAG: hypothetical protein JOY98_03815 [Candidatus Eremiobacteraeota bacterium]|nr:hypothetical protein [Candidatus Eremiobacteraeota bacterium]
MIAVVLLGALAMSATPGTAPPPRRAVFPPTRSGVHLNLVFNYAVPDLRREIGVVDVVWGSRSPLPRQVFNQFYTPFERDGPYAGTHRLAWFERYHPDWIEYRCDRKTPAWEFGDRSDVPIDIADPAVLQYQRSGAVDPAFAAGYRSIDFDNLSLGNYALRCGHYTTSKTWVAQYSGQWSDAHYRADVLAWAQSTYAYIHAYSATATMAINYSIQPQFGLRENYALMTSTDEVLDERGFTNWGSRSDNAIVGLEWRQIVAMIAALQRNGTCYMENGEEPGPSQKISQAERLWVVANYLLTRDDCTYVWMSGFTASGAQEYGTMWLYPEYDLRIGAPLGSMTAEGRGWHRAYSNGLALVNPTTTSAAFALKGTYRDENGTRYSGRIVLPAASGEVLLGPVH